MQIPEKPFVSIIIPVLNEELYIGKLLTCLESQTFKDFEVLVVDGGSKDATEKVVKDFVTAHNFPVALINSPKKGVSFQRNYGASLALSEKLIFIDADVRFEPDFLDKVTTFVRGNPDVDALSTWLKSDGANPIFKLMLLLFNVVGEISENFSPIAVGAFMLIKKPVFDDLRGFNETIVVAEDADLVSRVAKKGYNFFLLKNPRIYFSARRMESLGLLRFAILELKVATYYPLRRVLKKNGWVGYAMEGGSQYAVIEKNNEQVRK